MLSSLPPRAGQLVLSQGITKGFVEHARSWRSLISGVWRASSLHFQSYTSQLSPVSSRLSVVYAVPVAAGSVQPTAQLSF
jgi:hypothetical protein